MKEVNMLFAHDTERAQRRRRAGQHRAARRPTSWTTSAALDRFVDRLGVDRDRAGSDRAELDQVRALRPRLRALWHADEDAWSTAVNGMLREAARAAAAGDSRRVGLPPARHAGRRAAGRPDDGRGARWRSPTSSARGELDRLRVCDAPDCDDVVVDLSKNRSRRYCGASCSNRVNVAAFRARGAPADDGGTARSRLNPGHPRPTSHGPRVVAAAPPFLAGGLPPLARSRRR